MAKLLSGGGETVKVEEGKEVVKQQEKEEQDEEKDEGKEGCMSFFLSFLGEEFMSFKGGIENG